MADKIYLKDIAGYDEEKAEARKIITILKNYKEYEQKGVSIPKGLILNGVPGVGKTMLAKAIANESNAPLFEFEANESEQETKSIKNLKDLFKKAKETIPSIVFIDELDELVSIENYVSDYSRKVLKTILTEIDGVKNSNGIIVIATTNASASLPPALTRSGRMDKRITIEVPDLYSREAIVKLYLGKSEIFKNINAKLLATKIGGFTGADIKNLVNETLMDIVSNNRKNASMSDFEKAIPVLRFRDIKKISKKGPSISVCYHELGHLVCSYALKNEIPSISTEQYGNVKGHILIEQFNDESGDIMVKSQILNQIVITLGGQASEELFMNELTNGSVDDLGKATMLVNSMCASGMFGFEYLIPGARRGMGVQVSLSDDKAALIEKKQNEILNEAYGNAKSIIKMNKGLIEHLLIPLQERQKLTKIEVEELINEYQTKNNLKENEAK